MGAAPPSRGQEVFLFIGTSEQGKLRNPKKMRFLGQNTAIWKWVEYSVPRIKQNNHGEHGLPLTVEAAIARDA